MTLIWNAINVFESLENTNSLDENNVRKLFHFNHSELY